jgi:hypothetical protein
VRRLRLDRDRLDRLVAGCAPFAGTSFADAPAAPRSAAGASGTSGLSAAGAVVAAWPAIGSGGPAGLPAARDRGLRREPLPAATVAIATAPLTCASSLTSAS